MSNGEPLEEQAVIFVAILIIYILTAHLIEIRKVPFIHQSTIAMALGFLMAVFAKYALDTSLKFQSEFFFTIILPPIIFAAGYNLRKSLFFENLWMISFLGIAGTIIAFILLSSALFLINNFIFHILTTAEVLLVSAILCATDTVAAVSLIKPEKYPVLNAVLFGEGIINDAIAIILFRTVDGLHLDEDGTFTFTTVLQIIFGFCYLLVFSMMLGIFFGFGLSYLFKINQSFLHFPIKQTSLILLNGYFSYLLGEVLGLSGIITLFTNSVIMGHYSFMNVSEEAQRGTGLAFQTVGYAAEAFVYAYMGASVLSLSGSWPALWMALMFLVVFPLVRGAMVYLLPCIYWWTKKQFPMEGKQLKVCWFSGMVRGVIAYALCLQVEGRDEEFIQTFGLIMVMITTVLGSSFLKPFAACIGLDEQKQQDEGISYHRMIDDQLPQSKYHIEGLGYESSVPKNSSDNQMEYNRTKKRIDFGKSMKSLEMNGNIMNEDL